MTQQLAMDRIHPRRGFFAALAGFVGRTSAPQQRTAATTAPFDAELHLDVPFALLTTGPR